MGVAGEGVGREFQFLGLAPGGIAALAGVYLGIAGIVRVVGAACQVHCLAVGREAAGPLLIVAVHLPLALLRLRPVALVIEFGTEDVGTLHARDAARLVARGLVACRGEVEFVPLLTGQYGREVRAPCIEDGVLLYGVERRVGFPAGSQVAAPHTHLGHAAVGHRVEEQEIVLERILVVTVLLLHLGQVEEGHAVGIVVTQGILVSPQGLGREVYPAVALRHLPGPLPTFGLVLHGSTCIRLLVLPCRIEIFAYGIESISLLHVALGTAGCKQQKGGKGCHDSSENSHS